MTSFKNYFKVSFYCDSLSSLPILRFYIGSQTSDFLSQSYKINLVLKSLIVLKFFDYDCALFKFRK